MLEGLLLVDKPEGWTSFDVVNYVRGMIARELEKKPRSIKVGHTGTLDPAATGLLVLCIGKNYTKKVQSLIKHNKTYRAEITFGVTSITGDKEGELINDSAAKEFTKEQLEIALKVFVGKQKQTPPAYSALKVNGKRAYELARAGKHVELKQRDIEVFSIDMQSFSWPVASVSCSVSSGTYIRVLAEDIGSKLGIGAYLSNLRRTEIDKWSVDDAVSPKGLSIDIIREKLLV